MPDRKYPKLRGKTRDLASEYIAQEIRTKKYPRKQAIAIGISRARKEGMFASTAEKYRKQLLELRKKAAKYL